MKNNRVIELDPKERVLEKARKYAESIELFLRRRIRPSP